MKSLLVFFPLQKNRNNDTVRFGQKANNPEPEAGSRSCDPPPAKGEQIDSVSR
jgi:hypothetical protein